MQLNKFEGYEKTEETKDFAILFNPTRNPIEAWKDESIANYLLVYKSKDTVEAESDSIVVAMQYLRMAQDGLDNMFHGGEQPAPVVVAH